MIIVTDDESSGERLSLFGGVVAISPLPEICKPWVGTGGHLGIRGAWIYFQNCQNIFKFTCLQISYYIMEAMLLS